MSQDNQPKCHYEVLGLAITASDDDIKKAHRKLALQWHPDRQLGNEEEATAIYRRIQEAYEVLTNPQERAWYDSHREVILRGKEDALGINVSRYFSTSCFKGFADNTTGFFTIYSELFKKLAELEGFTSGSGQQTQQQQQQQQQKQSKMNKQPSVTPQTPTKINTTTTPSYDPDDIDDDMSTPSSPSAPYTPYTPSNDPDDIDDDIYTPSTNTIPAKNNNIPPQTTQQQQQQQQASQPQQSNGNGKTKSVPGFGCSTTTGTPLKEFYRHWLAFSTTRSFSWCDKYTTGDNEGRKMRRLVDAENEKLRSKGRSEFNSLIRGLVRQVQRHDPRWRRLVSNEQSERVERERIMAEELRLREIEKKKIKQAERSKALEEERERMEEDYRLYKEQYGSDVDDDYFGDRVSDGDDDSDHDSKNDNAVIAYECDLCQKQFKSDKTFLEHEKNGTHQKNVKQWEKANKLTYPTATELLAAIHESMSSQGIKKVDSKSQLKGKAGLQDVGVCNTTNSSVLDDDNNNNNNNTSTPTNNGLTTPSSPISEKERLRLQLLQEEAMMMASLAPLPPPPTAKNNNNNNNNNRGGKNGKKPTPSPPQSKPPTPTPTPPKQQPPQQKPPKSQANLQPINKIKSNNIKPSETSSEEDEDEDDEDEDEDDEDEHTLLYLPFDLMTPSQLKKAILLIPSLPKPQRVVRLKELQAFKLIKDKEKMAKSEPVNKSNAPKSSNKQEQAVKDGSDSDDSDNDDDEDVFLSFGQKKVVISASEDDADDHDEEDEDDDEAYDDEDEDEDGDEEDEEDEEEDDIYSREQLTPAQIERMKIEKKRALALKKQQEQIKKIHKARLAQHKSKYGLKMSNKEKKALEQQQQQQQSQQRAKKT